VRKQCSQYSCVQSRAESKQQLASHYVTIKSAADQCAVVASMEMPSHDEHNKPTVFLSQSEGSLDLRAARQERMDVHTHVQSGYLVQPVVDCVAEYTISISASNHNRSVSSLRMSEIEDLHDLPYSACQLKLKQFHIIKQPSTTRRNAIVPILTLQPSHHHILSPQNIINTHPPQCQQQAHLSHSPADSHSPHPHTAPPN
jgi:hypothetical protein